MLRIHWTHIALILCLLISSTTFASPPAKPNILFILIDDMGWRDLTCTGSTFYETPNIDRLAREGMMFTSAYAACPVCSPSRASILTGQYPARVGITDYIGGKSAGQLLPAPYLNHLPLEQFSLPRAMKAAGYTTWHVGKWHLGGKPYWPENQGFDVNIAGFAAGHPSSYFVPYKNPNLPDGPPGEYLTDRLTTEAIKLIHTGADKPWFMDFWHYAVHTPIQAPAGLIEKYRKKAAALGLDDARTLVTGEKFPILGKRSQHVVRRHIQSNPTYAAMIENLDTNVGRLLKTLDDLKLTDNTLVIFTSDNGGLSTAEGSPTSNDPLLDGKGWMYEGGTRVPLLVRWPGHIPPGSTCNVPVTGPDFYPTLLAAADLPPHPEQALDGVSFLPLLTAQSKSLPRDAIFWHYPHYGNQGGTPGSSVRAGDWKLIQFFEDNHLELYNLRTDPGETHDVAQANPQIVAKLQTQLQTWRDSVHAILPKPNPAWKAQ